MRIKFYFDNNGLARVKWMFRKRKSGYTLVELMVVIACLVIGLGLAFSIIVGGHFISKFW